MSAPNPSTRVKVWTQIPVLLLDTHPSFGACTFLVPKREMDQLHLGFPQDPQGAYASASSGFGGNTSHTSHTTITRQARECVWYQAPDEKIQRRVAFYDDGTPHNSSNTVVGMGSMAWAVEGVTRLRVREVMTLRAEGWGVKREETRVKWEEERVKSEEFDYGVNVGARPGMGMGVKQEEGFETRVKYEEPEPWGRVKTENLDSRVKLESHSSSSPPLNTPAGRTYYVVVEGPSIDSLFGAGALLLLPTAKAELLTKDGDVFWEDVKRVCGGYYYAGENYYDGVKNGGRVWGEEYVVARVKRSPGARVGYRKAGEGLVEGFYPA